MKQQGFFITGTDTGVGKTLVAAGLLSYFSQQGKRTAGIKPVASGAIDTPDGLRNDDALALQSAMSMTLPYQHVNPVVYVPPIAPHLAAVEVGETLSVQSLMEGMVPGLGCGAEVMVVEGSGGWSVPLNEGETMADLARALGFPVILVVGMRLGCLNHAALTLAAIEQSGLDCAGWIANDLDNSMLALEANIDTLKQILPIPMLARVPAFSAPELEQVAACFVDSPDLARHLNVR